MYRTLANVLPHALLLAAAVGCASGGGRVESAPAPSPEGAAPDRIEEGFEIDGAAPAAAPVRAGLLGSAAYDLPVEANPWVQMELDFLVNQRRSTIGRWMERGERYQGWVEEVFAGYGIPRDLSHLAMVESGYVPTARSRAGALGMWQFMPSTGRGMGLRIDDEVDERMDPVRSTHAAARHLRDLHRAFRGDWALAAAAYNAGAGRISRGLGRFGATDFWDLATRGDLAQETRHYVPRLYAVTIIAKDPARFGYPAVRGDGPRFAYDSLRVDVPTPLSEIARLAGIPLAALAELNPHLRQGMAPDNYWVWTPDGTGPALQVAFDSSAFRREGGYGYYTLRSGETVAEVAAAAGLPMERVRDLNLSRGLERMGRGDRLRLPAPAVRTLSARPAARLAQRTPARESAAESSVRAARPSRRAARAADDEARPSATRATRRSERTATGASHTVASGETLWAIARRFDVTVAQLRDANELSEDAAIRPGQALRIPSAAAGERGGEERPAARPAREPRRAATEPVRHTVAAGETLWSIARRYDTSVEAIRAANDLTEGVAIQPGQRLRIPRG